jgi:hypothetical protein
MADYIPIEGNRIELQDCCKKSLRAMHRIVVASHQIRIIWEVGTLAQVITSGNIPEAIFNLQGIFSDAEKLAKQTETAGHVEIRRIVYEEVIYNHDEGTKLNKFWRNVGKAWDIYGF